jgi:hypothetical protein
VIREDDDNPTVVNLLPSSPLASLTTYFIRISKYLFDFSMNRFTNSLFFSFRTRDHFIKDYAIVIERENRLLTPFPNESVPLLSSAKLSVPSLLAMSNTHFIRFLSSDVRWGKSVTIVNSDREHVNLPQLSTWSPYASSKSDNSSRLPPSNLVSISRPPLLPLTETQRSLSITAPVSSRAMFSPLHELTPRDSKSRSSPSTSQLLAESTPVFTFSAASSSYVSTVPFPHTTTQCCISHPITLFYTPAAVSSLFHVAQSTHFARLFSIRHRFLLPYFGVV